MVSPTLSMAKERAHAAQERRLTVERRIQAVSKELDTMPGYPGHSANLVDKEVRSLASSRQLVTRGCTRGGSA